MADSDASMQGKVCLITGATSGIGLAAAREIARCGARVVLIGRDPAECAAALRQVEAAAGSGRARSSTLPPRRK